MMVEVTSAIPRIRRKVVFDFIIDLAFGSVFVFVIIESSIHGYVLSMLFCD